MKALILNSGMGTRMGVLASEHPKCMTEVSPDETILSRQLNKLAEVGITEIVMTTGRFDSVLIRYCHSLDLPVHITFVNNPEYETTNYIYSIYCAREHLDDDIILMHGDLVFENEVIDKTLESPTSCMVVSSTMPLPDKDFKAVIKDNTITAVGVDLFNDTLAAQPLYKLYRDDWRKWLNQIIHYCESGNKKVYAENALNELNGSANIHPLDVRNLLCGEIDDADDLAVVSSQLETVESRTVYMSFSTDVLHGGHITIIKKAQRLGRLIIGVMSDEAVASYKRFPLVPASERKIMFSSLKGVHMVVDQMSLSYKDVLEKLKPDFVVHGNDWQQGFQKPIRDEVVSVLASYGGRLIEFPYSENTKYREIDERAQEELSLPDARRGRLKKLLDIKGFITAIEAHNGITGIIAEKTVAYTDGVPSQFDAMWISSLCDSTAKGKPDIELVDMTSRFRTVDEIMEVTTKPIIFDGDTGGRAEHFAYTVRSLERMGVSMVIIEDKTGLKKNSLFGTEVEQKQEDVQNFCEKIRIGKKAQKSDSFMICARIESLILGKGMDDAILRAKKYVDAGADAIMIHSCNKDANEIFEFLEKFREEDGVTPVVLVPTSYDSVYEEEFKEKGANIVIYANQLTRTGFPAMQETARSILENHRAKECSDKCMSIKDIITLIPEE